VSAFAFPGRDEPVSGCVSHIIETTGLDGYLFSAFVDDERVMTKEAPAAIGERSTTISGGGFVSISQSVI
jgi:hypothetical protein